MRSGTWRIAAALPLALAALSTSGTGAQTPARPAAARAVAAPPSAEALVAAGLTRATAENKTLLVDFRASWCGPCVQLQRFLAAPASKPIIDAHFIVVPITIWERDDLKRLDNPGGEKMFEKWGGDGIPFYVFLDGSGRKVQYGDGYPSGGFDIDDFLDRFAKAAPRLTAAHRDVLFEELASASRQRVWATPVPTLAGGVISLNARFLAYVRSDDAGLYVHDFVAALDRRLADLGDPTSATNIVFSRDGRRIAYTWRGTDGVQELRVANVTGGAGAAPRTLLADRSLSRVEPFGWTVDDKEIVLLTETTRQAGSRVVVVAADAGTWRERHVFTGGAARLAVAPDGRQFAVEVRGAGGTSASIAVMAAESGSPSDIAPSAEGARLIGWSPDSTQVLYRRTRSGTNALWAMEVAGPKLRRETEVQKNVGDLASLGITEAGHLYYLVRPSSSNDSLGSKKPSVWMMDGLFPKRDGKQVPGASPSPRR